MNTLMEPHLTTAFGKIAIQITRVMKTAWVFFLQGERTMFDARIRIVVLSAAIQNQVVARESSIYELPRRAGTMPEMRAKRKVYNLPLFTQQKSKLELPQ